MAKQDLKVVKSNIAGALYGALIGDLVTGANDDLLLPMPTFAENFSQDLLDVLRYMHDYAEGRFPVVDYMGHSAVTLLPDVLFYGRAMLASLPAPYPEPYQAAYMAFCGTIFDNQGNTSWRTVSRPQTAPHGLKTICEQWSDAVNFASASISYREALSMALGSGCGATAGALAGAKYGLTGIPSTWLAQVPLEARSLVGRFVNLCIGRCGDDGEVL